MFTKFSVGFYEIDNIKSVTVVKAMQDILLRCSLSLHDCSGQSYDVANNMMGKHSGVATLISAEQPKAVATHCRGHSLRLAVEVEAISTPGVPRKRKRPNYSILQLVSGNPRPVNEGYHPENASDHFKAIYNEAIDAIVNSICDRFEQPGFKTFGQVDQLFLKAIKKESFEDEMKVIEQNFNGDYDPDSLQSELAFLSTM